MLKRCHKKITARASTLLISQQNVTPIASVSYISKFLHTNKNRFMEGNQWRSYSTSSTTEPPTVEISEQDVKQSRDHHLLCKKFMLKIISEGQALPKTDPPTLLPNSRIDEGFKLLAQCPPSLFSRHNGDACVAYGLLTAGMKPWIDLNHFRKPNIFGWDDAFYRQIYPSVPECARADVNLLSSINASAMYTVLNQFCADVESLVMTPEEIIISLMFLFEILKGGRIPQGFRETVRCVVNSYPVFKSQRHANDSYLDLETDLPLHIGSFVKAIEAVLEIEEGNRQRGLELFRESLELCPDNFYTYILKGVFEQKGVNDAKQVTLMSITCYEKALAILSRAKLVPTVPLQRIQLDENPLPPSKKINDLKFIPVHNFLLPLYIDMALFSETKVEKDQYLKKALDCVAQVEQHSYFMCDAWFFFRKALIFYTLEDYEQCIHALNAVERYGAEFSLMKNAATLCIQCMLSLGYHREGSALLKETISKYGLSAKLVLAKLECAMMEGKTREEYIELRREVCSEMKQLEGIEEEKPYMNLFERKLRLLDKLIE